MKTSALVGGYVELLTHRQLRYLKLGSVVNSLEIKSRSKLATFNTHSQARGCKAGTKMLFVLFNVEMNSISQIKITQKTNCSFVYEIDVQHHLGFFVKDG